MGGKKNAKRLNFKSICHHKWVVDYDWFLVGLLPYIFMLYPTSWNVYGKISLSCAPATHLDLVGCSSKLKRERAVLLPTMGHAHQVDLLFQWSFQSVAKRWLIKKWTYNKLVNYTPKKSILIRLVICSSVNKSSPIKYCQ